MKKCYKCGIERPKEEFSKTRDAKDGRTGVCKACANKAHAEYRRLNRDKIASHKKTPVARVQSRRSKLRLTYGINESQFDGMFLRQLGMCGICSIGMSGETKQLTPHVDHCHKTGKVRGLLCGACNRGMGLLKDSYENCEKAAEWLKTA